MNGLFARLVREATGQPRNPVQAALPVRFQQDAEMAPLEPVYTQSEDVADSSARSPAAITESASPAVIPTRSDVQTTASPRDNASRPRMQAHFEPPAEESVEVPLQVPDTALEPPATRRAKDRGVPLNELPVASADVVTLPEIGSPGDYQDQPAGDSQTGARLSALDKSQAKNQVAPGTPEPLLPAFANAALVNGQNASQSPGVTEDSPGEVHVHIGRIEVTALPSTTAPKAKPRSARQPMSLDDYLVRRGPGRS